MLKVCKWCHRKDVTVTLKANLKICHGISKGNLELQIQGKVRYNITTIGFTRGSPRIAHTSHAVAGGGFYILYILVKRAEDMQSTLERKIL